MILINMKKVLIGCIVLIFILSILPMVPALGNCQSGSTLCKSSDCGGGVIFYCSLTSPFGCLDEGSNPCERMYDAKNNFIDYVGCIYNPCAAKNVQDKDNTLTDKTSVKTSKMKIFLNRVFRTKSVSMSPEATCKKYFLSQEQK